MGRPFIGDNAEKFSGLVGGLRAVQLRGGELDIVNLPTEVGCKGRLRKKDGMK